MSDLNPPAGSDLGISKQTTQNYARYVFWVMFLISFLNYMDRYILNGAANVVARELGFGIDGIGYIASAFLVVYTLATVPLGIWADRAKRKDVVAISVAIWSLATAFTALANSFITLFISRMVLGIGEAGYFPAGTALMSDYFCRKLAAGLRLHRYSRPHPGISCLEIARAAPQPGGRRGNTPLPVHPGQRGRNRGATPGNENNTKCSIAVWLVTTHQDPGRPDYHADFRILCPGRKSGLPAHVPAAERSLWP